MRFSKHGDVLAIALPESLRKKLGITSDSEYEFFEVEDGVLALVRKDKLGRIVGDRVLPILKKENPAPAASPAPGPSWQGAGFQVLEDEGSAKLFSQQHEKLIKTGEIRGVRGFDKRFYLCTRSFYETASAKILQGLKEKPKTAETLSAELKIPLNGILVTVYLLKEEGEVLEKKRGEFSLVK